jgi:hypothetical protein
MPTEEQTISPATPNPERRQKAVPRLFVDAYSGLLNLGSDDPHIHPEDASLILEGVANHLNSYDSPLDVSSFIAWASDIVIRVRDFDAVKRQCEPFVRSAIWRTLGHATEPSKFDDYPSVDWLNADAKDLNSGHDFGKDIPPRLVGKAAIYAYNFLTNRIPGEP